MNDLLIEEIVKSGGDPNNIKGFKPFSSDEEIDKFAIMNLEHEIKTFWPLFYERGWVLLNRLSR